MINVVLWLVLGGVVGWCATLVMQTHTGRAFNVSLGILGACASGLAFRALGLPGSNIEGGLSVDSVFVSLIGAILLIFAVQMLRRSTAAD